MESEVEQSVGPTSLSVESTMFQREESDTALSNNDFIYNITSHMLVGLVDIHCIRCLRGVFSRKPHPKSPRNTSVPKTANVINPC